VKALHDTEKRMILKRNWTQKEIFLDDKKMSNTKETSAMMYGFLLLILADIVFIIFAETIFDVEDQILYGIFMLILLFSVWRIIKLRTFSLEASQHVLSVKYHHPLTRSKKPVLEVPLQKVLSFNIEKGMMDNDLVISIKTRKGIRSFSYNMGAIPEKNIEKLNYISEFIHSSRMEAENQK